MSPRTILLMAAALICGASAVVVAYQWRSSGTSETTVPVLTAKTDVMRGNPLNESVVTVSRYEKGLVPAGALSSFDELGGRVVLFPLSKGEPIVQHRLTAKDGGRGLAVKIEKGMRAFTIPTTHVAAGVGGFIQPGDKVDVLLTTSPTGPDDNTGGGVTTTLLQNVEVLAVGERLDPPGGGSNSKEGAKEIKAQQDAKSVTLLVSPDHAARLDLGMNKGILHLTLRKPTDEQEANTRPATMLQLRFDQQKPIKSEDFAEQAAGVTVPKDTEVTMPPREARKSPAAVAQQPSAEIWQLRGSRFDRPIDLYR